MTEFDQKNHWLIDRGNGPPSVNLVILSFIHPLRLLNKTTDAQTAQGVPVGMNAAEVAQKLGVGIEIDYEENASPNLAGLQAFIDAYRSVLPYGTSLTSSTGSFVTSVAPAPNGAGTSSGMLGYMFWAAECQGTRSICTTPPNTCQAGVGAGATAYGIPVPMPALRQN